MHFSKSHKYTEVYFLYSFDRNLSNSAHNLKHNKTNTDVCIPHTVYSSVPLSTKSNIFKTGDMIKRLQDLFLPKQKHALEGMGVQPPLEKR